MDISGGDPATGPNRTTRHDPSAVRWLRERDRGFAALRRAGRTAIVMPAMFALGDVVIGNPAFATFAAFGSFAMLLLVDFAGPMRARLQAQAALAVTGGVFVCLGTLASRSAVARRDRDGARRVRRAVRRGRQLGAGGRDDVAAAGLHPAGLAARRPPRRSPIAWPAGALASAASLLAIALLWPAPARDPVRGAAIAGCRALAAGCACRSPAARCRPQPTAAERDAAIARADDAVEALHAVFFATPYRPTGLSTAARAMVRLVDELRWLDAIVVHAAPPRSDRGRLARGAVKAAAAEVLERGADLLDAPRAVPPRRCTRRSPSCTRGSASWSAAPPRAPARRCRRRDLLAGSELPRAGAELRRRRRSPRNVDLAAAAERRSWLEQLLGRQPAGLAGPLSAAQERAGAHVERHSLWLQQQRPRRRRPRPRRARRRPHRRAARVLGRARDAVGAALERAEHRAERARAACSARSRASSSAACSSCSSAPTRRCCGCCCRSRSCSPASRPPRSRSPPGRPRSRSRC